MNIVVTERDKKLLRLVACLAIIVIFGMYDRITQIGP